MDADLHVDRYLLSIGVDFASQPVVFFRLATAFLLFAYWILVSYRLTYFLQTWRGRLKMFRR